MSGNEVAVILTALGGVITTIVVAMRGFRGDKRVAEANESAALLSGYTAMVTSLREEIKMIRKDNDEETQRIQRLHNEELERARRLCDEDRQKWLQDRERLEHRIEQLEDQVQELIHRPPTMRTRATDQ